MSELKETCLYQKTDEGLIEQARIRLDKHEKIVSEFKILLRPDTPIEDLREYFYGFNWRKIGH